MQSKIQIDKNQIKMTFRKLFILMIALLLIPGCKISSVREGEAKIEKRFLDTFYSSKNSKSATLLVHSDRLQFHIKSQAGFIASENGNLPTSADEPFHTASVGKLFTAIMIFQLIEENKLSLDDSIETFLGKELLKDLFVVEGQDSSSKVTVTQLLSHMSGIEDYFESTDKNSKAVLHDITIHPDKFWTPKDLLDFTRKNQKAVALPGEKFHYSDTGYILLGLILEKIYKKSFETIIKEKIFQPLGMKNSYMHLRSLPLEKTNLPISTMMLGKTDVTNFKSISCDWSGGGMISTTEDLLRFQKALIEGKILKKKTLESMKGNHKFMDGILYGKGLMTVDFSKMSFLIPSTPLLYGHSGVLGTLLFYSPDYDTHIIVNLGSTDDVDDSFELMFWIMDNVKDIENLQKEKHK